MRSMSRVERFFERLVERPTARLFRPRLQAIQVLRRIERAMESGRGEDLEHNVVPDRFTVHINPADVAALEPLDDVAADLASGALAFARSHQMALRGRPRVAIHPDPDVRPGEVEVEGRLSRPKVGNDAPDPETATRVFSVPVARAPAATLEIREPNGATRRVELNGRPMRIGRSTECELVIRDTRVSRQHARLHARGGLLVLTDLASTNGTRVNGQRITEVVLGAGDRIAMGDSTLLVSVPEAPGGGADAGDPS